tara:strand:+ start:80 stop:265 length:186 start_codon:yes stop_codon:yes gene_type:complete
MSKVQLRLYVETDDKESSDKERQYLQYIRDMFHAEYTGFEEDVKEAGHSILIHKALLEHGW